MPPNARSFSAVYLPRSPGQFCFPDSLAQSAQLAQLSNEIGCCGDGCEVVIERAHFETPCKVDATNTGDGRKRAMAKGVKFGRKPKLYQRQEALKRRAAGETLAEIAKSYAVDISMISRLAE
jgi:hypothetical protein